MEQTTCIVAIISIMWSAVRLCHVCSVRRLNEGLSASMIMWPHTAPCGRYNERCGMTVAEILYVSGV
jgi:hypothetical protein